MGFIGHKVSRNKMVMPSACLSYLRLVCHARVLSVMPAHAGIHSL